MQAPGYRYTDALRNSDIQWTVDNMLGWLTNPKKYIKGTSMAFPGLKKAIDRESVVAYLNGFQSALPAQSANGGTGATAEPLAPVAVIEQPAAPSGSAELAPPAAKEMQTAHSAPPAKERTAALLELSQPSKPPSAKLATPDSSPTDVGAPPVPPTLD